MIKIAFDIDGTLKGTTKNNMPLIKQLRKFAEDGHDVIVWSGGGVEYAQRFVERLELPARVVAKCSEKVHFAFDDATEHLKGALLTVTLPFYD